MNSGPCSPVVLFASVGGFFGPSSFSSLGFVWMESVVRDVRNVGERKKVVGVFGTE